MSIILECIGCRETKVFPFVDKYPVCPDCQKWEEEHFRELHKETWLIRQLEKDVIHDGHREGYIKPEKTTSRRPSIPEWFKWAIFERDNFTCQSCGCRKFLTVDHIRPFSKGGELTLENCQTLCRSCNSKKGAR